METAVPGIGTSTVAISTPVKATGRLLFVDNIRIFLTVLVILHHLMVIYAGSGGWIYHEGRQDDITSALGGWFCAVNQAYFMGLFLFIAAYFVPGAYDRKGPMRLLSDRLVRLGIPLAVYGWVLRPVFIYLGFRQDSPFLTWYTREYFRNYGILGGGPLWFIETLLVFSILYVVARLLIHPQRKLSERIASFPGNGAIVLFALLLGGVTFLVRIATPVNSTFAPLNLQFANFAQYIALFITGLVAYQQSWLTTLPDKTGGRWLLIAVLLVLVYAPLGVLTGATENADPFLGGWHWQSLLLALWEAFLCISACIGLVSLFRRRLDRQGRVAQELSRSAYTAYIIHEPVISFLAALTAGVMLYPLLKFVLASLFFVSLCFGLSSLIRRLPYVERVV